MNFYWRQTIVGLLRHAAEQVPSLAGRCTRVSGELDRTLTSLWLEKAFSLFQEAAATSHDPVYVTGAFYTMRALDEVRRWEDQAGGPAQAHRDDAPSSEDDDINDEAQRGMMELFDRIRRGATLMKPLPSFPRWATNTAPSDLSRKDPPHAPRPRTCPRPHSRACA